MLGIQISNIITLSTPSHPLGSPLPQFAKWHSNVTHTHTHTHTHMSIDLHINQNSSKFYFEKKGLYVITWISCLSILMRCPQLPELYTLLILIYIQFCWQVTLIVGWIWIKQPLTTYKAKIMMTLTGGKKALIKYSILLYCYTYSFCSDEEVPWQKGCHPKKQKYKIHSIESEKSKK